MLNKNIINNIVNAFELEKGQLILLQYWGEDEDRRILNDFSEAIVQNGAMPLEMHHGREYYKNLFSGMTENIFNDKYFNIFKEVDVVVDICMYQPVIPAQDFPADKMNIYREHMRNLFNAINKKDKFIQVRIPSKEFAHEAGMEEEEFINRMVMAYDINYVKLKEDATALIEQIKSKNKILISTNNDSKLELYMNGRTWFMDTGGGDLPCGEIYIAPIENKSNGSIYFETLLFDNQIANEVTVTIESGKIIESNHTGFNDFINELPPNGNVISEFGIGLNENVTSLCGYALLDEKMINTYHIAIGSNIMFGGTNDSMCHIDLVFRGDVEFE
jgi:leucyl aminopeptidase (aminopeptidase T)